MAKKNEKRYGGRNGTRDPERQAAAAGEQPQHSEKRSIVSYCCGRANHTKSECRYREYKCKYCNKQGHLERACRIKQAKEEKSKTSVNLLHEGSAEEGEVEIDLLKKMEFYKLELNENECKDESNDIVYEKNTNVYNISNKSNDVCKNENAEPMYINVIVNNKNNVRFEIDTGTYATVISKKIFDDHFRDLQIVRTNFNLKSYDNSTLQPMGKLADLEVNILNKIRKLECVVLPGIGPALIGRQWLAAFDLWPLNLPGLSAVVNKMEIENVSNYFAVKYKELFREMPGLYNRGKAVFHLKENVRPIAMKFRTVAHALKPMIEEEIEKLVESGHLVPVQGLSE